MLYDKIAHKKFSISQRKGGGKFALLGDHSFIHSLYKYLMAACCLLGAVLESRAVQAKKIEQSLYCSAGQQRWEG